MQARSMGEAQADVTIRGGTFENTGFSLGAIPLYDPQTGHYSAEIPVAPAMLQSPQVDTGSAAARSGWNATAGNIAYGWKPVVSGGEISLGGGSDSLLSSSLYAGHLFPDAIMGQRIGFDVNAAYSRDSGPVDMSDHEFARYNFRLQLQGGENQTDLFAGYQTKDFAWPNLYAGRTPGGPWREEREDLKTQLYAFNHRQNFGNNDDFLQFGAYHRIHQDHYSIPVFNYHARHKTHVTGAALEGKITLLVTPDLASTVLRYRTGAIADSLTSSELIYGNYSSRTQYYAGIYADQTIPVAEQQDILLTAGLTYDGSNRAESGYSPVAGIRWRNHHSSASLSSIGFDYAASSQLPTYQALNSSPAGLFGGDADLGRIRSRNFEINATLNVHNWEISPALFYRQDRDLVDWVFDPSNPASNRSARAVDLDTWGLELLARHSWKNLNLTTGYTWMHKRDHYTSPVTASFYALNFAEHRFTVALTVDLGHGFELRSDNEVRIQEKNSLRSGTRTPVLSSLGISYAVSALPGLRVGAQVDNLWNVYYEEVPLVPGTPRTWSLQASYAW